MKHLVSVNAYDVDPTESRSVFPSRTRLVILIQAGKLGSMNRSGTKSPGSERQQLLDLLLALINGYHPTIMCVNCDQTDVGGLDNKKSPLHNLLGQFLPYIKNLNLTTSKAWPSLRV